jgi:hypothetical protein
VSAARRAEGDMRETRPATRLDWASHDRIVAGQGLCGRDRIRTCVGNAGDFTGRTAVSPGVPSRPRLGPDYRSDVHKRPAGSLRHHLASPPVPPCPARPGVGRSESGAKSLGLGSGPGPAPDHRVGGTPRDRARPSSPCDRRREAATQAEIQPRRRTDREWRQPRPRTMSCSWRVPPRGSWRLSQKL